MENEENKSNQNNNASAFNLINAMEEIVIQKVKDLIERDKEMCNCEKCFNDICAIVLNSIKPKYSTTELGNLYARLGNLSVTESSAISVEIVKAMEIVRNKPGH